MTGTRKLYYCQAPVDFEDPLGYEWTVVIDRVIVHLGRVGRCSGRWAAQCAAGGLVHGEFALCTVVQVRGGRSSARRGA